MSLDEPPNIRAGPLLSLVPIVRRGAEDIIVVGVLPGLPRQLVDGGVERGQDGAVRGRIIEASGHDLDLARKAGEDVDAAVAAHDVRYQDAGLR